MSRTSYQYLTAIKVCALRYWHYFNWTGPANIRYYELLAIQRDMVLLCALYQAERRKEKSNAF